MSPTDSNWGDSQPIYRQLQTRVISMVLEGALKEGDALPSVRQVAGELRINPLTVLKAYQQLADEGLVEKRRGMGMFIAAGAAQKLLAAERTQFLQNEWPRVRAQMRRLGLDAAALLVAPVEASPSPTLNSNSETNS